MAIRIGTLGCGNLGKGVEYAIKHNPNMELKIVSTRRNSSSLSVLMRETKVHRAEETLFMKDETDVMILCGGSATDLPAQTPEMAVHFNMIDSFNTHASTPRHFEVVDKAVKEGGYAETVSVGWDPDMFSLNGPYVNVILPGDSDYTFWGKGVNQGHSDAARRTKGVRDARQYTILVEVVLTVMRSRRAPELTTRDKHTRECSVVAEEGTDLKAIEETIITMPNYSADYDTMTHLISQEKLMRGHTGIPHGGFAIRTGSTRWNDESGHAIGYSLRLDSSPELTVSAIVAYAGATYRLSREGRSGCRTVFSIVPAHLSPADGAEPRKHLF